MRVLFWYCNQFSWTPAIKTLEQVPDAEPDSYSNTIVAFVHVEPDDLDIGSSSETKLVKNSKWLARKWDVKTIILHSFTHLGKEKADPEKAGQLLQKAENRLTKAGYKTLQTPYGYFLDLLIQAEGHPLARIYKEF